LQIEEISKIQNGEHSWKITVKFYKRGHISKLLCTGVAKA